MDQIELIEREVGQLLEGDSFKLEGGAHSPGEVNEIAQDSAFDISSTSAAAVWNRLDDRQVILIRQRTKSGYRRVKGSAGSGKTIVAAARAVEVASQDKHVLVVVYNRTMASKMRSLIDFYADETERTDAVSRIEVSSVHAFFYRLVRNSGTQVRSAGNDFDSFENALLEALKSLLKEGKAGNLPKYHAIIIDEGQDFSLE